MNSCDDWFRFNANDGCLTIHEEGLYFLHAQVNNTLAKYTYFCIIIIIIRIRNNL